MRMAEMGEQWDLSIIFGKSFSAGVASDETNRF
jgi:hypothetical protein